MKLKPIIISVVASVLAVGIFCAEWSNPYLDKSKSGVEILEKSFSDKDTVEIFSGESLNVAVYLREYIESFSISAPKNRLWNKDEYVVLNSELDKGSLSFAFSFYDTGWHDITLTTNFNGSTPSKKQTFSLYVKSPLFQQDINAKNRDSVLLETEAVRDSDVYYVWKLGNIVFKSASPSIKEKVDFADTSFDGELYVVDKDSTFRSSSFVFPVQFSTGVLGTLLEIACVNSPMLGDTAFVTSKSFTFSAKVTGAEELKMATINSENFDTQEKTSDGAFLLSKKFDCLDTLKEPLEIHVYCKNEKDMSKDSYFYLKYPSQIAVALPDKDTINTGNAQLSISGTISNELTKDTVTIWATNNETPLDSKQLTNGNEWEYVLALDSGWNNIVLEFRKGTVADGAVLESIKKSVNYIKDIQGDTTKPDTLTPDPQDPDTALVDTIPPKIVSITSNGVKLLDKHICRKDTLPLELTVTDNKKIGGVFVNDSLCSVTDSGTFVVNVKLEHKENTLRIIAIDSTSNTYDTSITVLHNRKPVSNFTFDYQIIYADSTYEIPISVTDSDDDPVTIVATVKSGKNKKICEIKEGYLELKAEAADVDSYFVEIKAFDWCDTVGKEIKFTVVKQKPKLVKVGNIPDTLRVDKDTLNVELEVESYSGTPPFTFTAFWGSTKIGTEKTIKWIPTKDNIGKEELMLIVTDNLKMSDTIKCSLTVAKPPVYVNWSLTSAKYKEGDTVDIEAKLSSPLEVDSVGITFSLKSNSGKKGIITFENNGAQTISFKKGDTAASVQTIFIGNDYIDNDSVSLKLMESSNNDILVGSDSTFDITILNNDTITFSFTEGASSDTEGDTIVDIPVERSTSFSLKPVVLYCEFDEQSSTASKDDFRMPDSIVFEPWNTQLNLKLEIVDDTIPEENETVVIKLESRNIFLVGGEITTYTYTIIANERMIEFVHRRESQLEIVNDTAFYDGEDNWTVETHGQISISSRLRPNSRDSVTVYFEVIQGLTTAISGTDYILHNTERKVTFSDDLDEELEKTVGFEFKKFPPNTCNPKYVYLRITGLSNYKKAYIGNNKILKIIIKPSRETCSSQGPLIFQYW